MAQQPAPPSGQPPESMILGLFKGIRNTVSRERLAPDELELAINVDVDDAQQLHRRRGYNKVSTGGWHSAWRGVDRVFAVKDFMLGVINPDYSFTTLQFAGPDPVAYVQVGDEVYFSSRSVSGIIHKDNFIEPWGAVGGSGLWISPVVNPNFADNGIQPIRGKLLRNPPFATDLAYFNGRIYLAAGTVLWATELYNYRYVDATKTFYQFEDELTCLGAVTDGLYVGTASSIWFLSGPASPLTRIAVQNSGAIANSLQIVPSELFIPEQQRAGTASKNAVVVMTHSGLCVGFDGGVFNNLTQNNVLFPQAETMASLFRRQDGVNHYVGVMDSRGTPTSSTRIGDYVDAEIRRFSGA